MTSSTFCVAAALVVIAFFAGAPIGYFLLSRWLEEFAYRISFGWGAFILAGSVVLLLALCTVSFHSMKAALSNPVNSLRQE